jgi:hypothetical protein
MLSDRSSQGQNDGRRVGSASASQRSTEPPAHDERWLVRRRVWRRTTSEVEFPDAPDAEDIGTEALVGNRMAWELLVARCRRARPVAALTSTAERTGFVTAVYDGSGRLRLNASRVTSEGVIVRGGHAAGHTASEGVVAHDPHEEANLSVPQLLMGTAWVERVHRRGAGLVAAAAAWAPRLPRSGSRPSGPGSACCCSPSRTAPTSSRRSFEPPSSSARFRQPCAGACSGINFLVLNGGPRVGDFTRRRGRVGVGSASFCVVGGALAALVGTSLYALMVPELGAVRRFRRSRSALKTGPHLASCSGSLTGIGSCRLATSPGSLRRRRARHP